MIRFSCGLKSVEDSAEVQLRGVLGQAQQVGDLLLVIDDDQPVGEQPARVRCGGPVPVDRAALILLELFVAIVPVEKDIRSPRVVINGEFLRLPATK